MLLAIDAGNTNVKFGLFQGDTLLRQWRVRPEPGRTADEYAAILFALFAQAGLTFGAITGIALASVVPQVTPDLLRLAREHLGHEPLHVTPRADLGLEIAYQPPDDVGTDRLMDAVAAVHQVGAPCIVIDFGTATTFNAVAAPRLPGGMPVYLGGAICLGIGVSLEALFSRAAKIPSVELARPLRAIGDTTAHALQSGIVFGYLSQVQGLVQRFWDEMDAAGCPVVATGGHAADLIAAETSFPMLVDPTLTLTGLRLTYARAQGQL
jgi:type III pantothenate kinase